MPIEIHHLSSELPEWWRELLAQWGQLMDDYCKFDESDAPYWYGERALTGLLAAAAWRLPDGWSLEEFITLRESGEQKRPGRCDAWIGRGHEWWTIECKCPWIYSADPGTAIQNATWYLNEAQEQLAALDKTYRGASAMVICYLVPALLDGGPEVAPDRVQALFDGVVTHFHGQAVVATYRPPGQPFRTSEDTSEKRRYPGCIVVAELAPRPSQ